MKYAGIDIGETNLMAAFVDDETTKSLLIAGKPFKNYNKMVDKLIEQLNESKAKKVPGCDMLISSINAKRNKFFHNQFHRMTKYVVEYLHFYGVTHLFISKRLANHRFIQMPFAKLIDSIRQEAQGHEIDVKCVDERFTSQVSSISGDIQSVQKNPNLKDAYKGKRINRNTFFDTVINEKFNADLNAAVNHIKVGTNKNFDWLKDKLFKLKDPIIIKSEEEFEKLLERLRNNKSSKSAN